MILGVLAIDVMRPKVASVGHPYPGIAQLKLLRS